MTIIELLTPTGEWFDLLSLRNLLDDFELFVKSSWTNESFEVLKIGELAVVINWFIIIFPGKLNGGDCESGFNCGDEDDDEDVEYWVVVGLTWISDDVDVVELVAGLVLPFTGENLE